MACEIVRKNLGKSKCFEMPTLPKAMITTPEDFVLAPADYATMAALKTALQNGIKAAIQDRIYLWPRFSSVEMLNEEAQYEDTPLGIIPIRDGQYRFRAGIHKNLCMHKAMYSHRAVNEGRIFIIDVNNQLWANEDVDGNLRGFSIALLHTEKLMINESASTKSPVYVCLSDNEEFDAEGTLLEIGSLINQLDPLTDVDITLVGNFAAAGFSVEVKQSCDQTPVSGLLEADFLLYAADGVTLQALETVTEDANVSGRYAIAAPGADDFEDGSLTLRAPSALTAAVGAFENVTPLTVNIP